MGQVTMGRKTALLFLQAFYKILTISHDKG